MSSQNLPSMQEARQLRTSGMDATQMYEEVRAIAGESVGTPLSRGPQRSSFRVPARTACSRIGGMIAMTLQT